MTPRKFLYAVNRVTVADLQRVAPLYLPRLFEADQSRTTAVCHPAKLEEIIKGFSNMGVELSVLESVDDLGA